MAHDTKTPILMAESRVSRYPDGVAAMFPLSFSLAAFDEHFSPFGERQFKVAGKRVRGLIEFRWFLVPCALLAAVFVGCGDSSADKVPAYNPSGSSAEAIKLHDANANGSLESAELMKCPSLLVALPRIDQDGNGKLTAAELSARIAFYKAQSLALVSFECTVLSNGQPLPNAKVTLVPEEFMKQTLRPAMGITDQAGRTVIATEASQATGVQLGLYRVQVSSKNEAGQEMIPAQFNTMTTLGIEVSNDVPGLERGVVFELK